MKKKRNILLITIVILALGFFFRFPIMETVFNGPGPIKYWFRNPTNFKECTEITNGLILKTLPAQCEVRGKRFIDSVKIKI